MYYDLIAICGVFIGAGIGLIRLNIPSAGTLGAILLIIGWFGVGQIAYHVARDPYRGMS